MKLPMLDLLDYIDEVARLDPEPKFVFQIYSYVYIGYGGWRAALEIMEGDYTIWIFECDGVFVYAEQYHDEPIEFTFYPPDYDYEEQPI